MPIAKTYLITAVLLLISLHAFAQQTLSTKNKKAIELYTIADNFRVRGQHQQAIQLLNQALDKDKNFMEAYYRLGVVYLTIKNYSLAIQNYEKGLSLTADPNKQKVFWFDLGETYFALGQYEKSIRLYTDFLNVEKTNRQKIDKANLMLQNAEFSKQNSAIATKYKLHALSDTVNHFVMQYFPVLTADQHELIFTRRLSNDPNSDEDLVVSAKDASGKWTLPISISKNINSPLNEGTSTISADGRKLIFTSCIGREGHGSCDLYQSTKVGNEWSEPINLGSNVNSVEWESQPSLSADGRMLYFVSDRRGGFGRRDIWVSTQNEKGQWTKARNVGKPVNTIYDEISPFIHVNNQTLYFASNGLTGFGGYDIFYVERDTSGTWSKPVNIGTPINNHEDQFSLFITADGKKGYYSHEETGTSGQSASKIYEIEIPEESQVKYKSNYVTGIVKDKETRQPLTATVELIDIKKNETISLVKSDSLTGEYLIVLTQGAEYALYISKPGYLFQSQNFNYEEVKYFKPVIQNVDLEKIKTGSVSILNNIFFDFDKYELQLKSETELEKVICFLNENPTVKIEVGGHTDNVGSPNYNVKLSQSRSAAVKNYFVTHGINTSRISIKGYGSSHPLGENDTEDGRKLNRRIEFTILQ